MRVDSMREERNLVITVDGPAASGKTSMSRELAEKLGWKWVSTGAFYRGLAYVLMQLSVDLDNEDAVVEACRSSNWSVRTGAERTLCYYNDLEITDHIYSESVGTVASQVSVYPKVREILLGSQRNCLVLGQGLVAEGRDCGTVVFPAAPLKVYLTAKSESRALRRVEEQGGAVEDILAAQKQRDRQDSSRKVAPMEIPEGALVVDTSELDLMQVVEKVEKKARETFKV